MAGRNLCLILNGKKAGGQLIRDVVEHIRQLGHLVDVRITWEAGEASRFAAKAIENGVEVVMTGGGDGTVNEVVNGIMRATESPQSAMAVLPLGSANDFATGLGIPMDNPLVALELATWGDPTPIDVGRVNDRYFLNAVIADFGAEVTFNTSERLKQRIGGGAYALTGFLTALKPTAHRGKVTWEGGSDDGTMIFAAVANGRQAGGFALAPKAMLNNGLLDVMSVPDFSPTEIPTVLLELQDIGSKELQLIRYQQVEWFEVEAVQEIPLTPDGEQMSGTHFRFEALKRRLPFILPPDVTYLSKA
jgi:lipid kinase YegS